MKFRPSRRGVRVLVVLLAVVFGAGLLAAATFAAEKRTKAEKSSSPDKRISSDKGPVTSTKVIRFVPEVPKAEKSGECWTSSVAQQRPDAWRCGVQNLIYDPCFLAKDGKTIVCGADPVKKQGGFRLKTTKALPRPSSSSTDSKSAWMIQLEDGAVCLFATGATGEIGGERINYFCGDESREGLDVIIGDLEPGSIWSAKRWTGNDISDDPQGKLIRKVKVRTAWQ